MRNVVVSKILSGTFQLHNNEKFTRTVQISIVMWKYYSLSEMISMFISPNLVDPKLKMK